MHSWTNMKLHRVVGSAAAALLLALTLVCSAQEKGWFGFEIKADTQGFSFNPTGGEAQDLSR